MADKFQSSILAANWDNALNGGLVAYSILDSAQSKQEALAILGAGVRPNDALNPLALVNQKGESSYNNPSGSSVYAFDGRKGRHYTVSLADGVETISISGQSTGSARYGLVVPKGVKTGKIYTASVLIQATSVVGNPYFMVSNNLSSIAKVVYITQQQEYALLSVTFTAASDGDSVLLELVAGNGSSLSSNVRGWKMEEGPTQTLAYQKSDGSWELLPQPENDYATQLLKCQQYYIPVVGEYPFYGRTNTSADTGISAFFPTPIRMRATPVWTGNPSDFMVCCDEQNIPVSAISSITVKPTGLFLSLAVPSGIGTKKAVVISCVNHTKAGFDASL